MTQNTGGSSVAGVYRSPSGVEVEIREVYADNLNEEMSNIRRVVEKYPYIAMDTEFPGIVAKPVGDHATTADYQYQSLKCNVDLLKIIQLGLTFTDSEGNFPPGCACWQFNFKFNLADDMYAQDSIDLLRKSGIDFEQNRIRGIESEDFGEQLMMSGLLLDPEVRWLSFHSSYDFGYLVKSLTCTDLPPDEVSFLELLRTYFPTLYDMKFMMTSCDGLHGGLQSLADAVQVERIGPMHQAGSDSLLTAQTFFKLVQRHFMGTLSSNGSSSSISSPQSGKGSGGGSGGSSSSSSGNNSNTLSLSVHNFEDSRFRGELFGLGNNYTKYRPPPGSQAAAGATGGGGSVIVGNSNPSATSLSSTSSSSSSHNSSSSSSSSNNSIPTSLMRNASAPASFSSSQGGGHMHGPSHSHHHPQHNHYYHGPPPHFVHDDE